MSSIKQEVFDVLNREKSCNGITKEQTKLGEHVGFERVRRVTGYLTGDYKKTFNDAKQAEVADRVKHTNINKDDLISNGYLKEVE